MNTPHLQLADGTFVYLLDVPEASRSGEAIAQAVRTLMNVLNAAELLDVRVVGYVDGNQAAPHFVVEVRTRTKPQGGMMTL